MRQAFEHAAALPVHRLRQLDVDASTHPRGMSFLSAASGLVCRHGRAYVMADDELHLAVFRDAAAPGRLHRVFAGELPEDKKARKKRKPDLETLLWWPDPAGRPSLLALGSGSRANRQRGVRVMLDTQGEPLPEAQAFDLAPVYDGLRGEFGRLNIEGAFVSGDELVLLNRGLADGRDNAALHYRVADVRAVIDGRPERLRPTRLRHHALPRINGVSLNFTDGAALPGGGWAFTAVAEDTECSVADGAFLGAVVGLVDAMGDIVALRSLAAAKVEGVDVRRVGSALQLCLVSDADDPAVPSLLLLAHW